MRKLLLALLFAARVAQAMNSSACPTMTPYNVFIMYNGSSSNCLVATTPCMAGELIQFGVGAFGYDFSCSAHTFSWDFGDNTTATTRYPTHVYVAAGLYAVRVTITSGIQQQTLTLNVFVRFIDPPPPLSYQDLFDENGVRVPRGYRFIAYVILQGGDWLWDFGDGTTVRGAQFQQTHVYQSGGRFVVTLTSALNSNRYMVVVNAPIDRRRSARH